MSPSPRLIAVVLLGGVLLAACQSNAPQPVTVAPPLVDLREPYLRAEAANGEVFTLDAAESTVRIYVFRGGKAARAGHNHVLGVASFEGYVLLDSLQPSDSRFDLRIPVDSLTVDDPAWREQTGGHFSSKRSESDVEGTRRNLLGPKVLDAVRFPVVELRSQAISGDWPMLVADVAITIKGATRVQPVLIRASREADGLRVAGELVLRQSEFGIEPFSVLGGLMAVQDEIGITFEFRGHAGLAR